MGDQRIDFVVYLKQMSFSHPLPMGGSYRVGRGASAHVRIDDPSVSREHLLIHTSPDGAEIEELGSSNGTLLYPMGSQAGSTKDTIVLPHKRYKLREGDVIRIGSVAALVKVREIRSGPSISTIPPASFSPGIRRDPEMKRIYDLAMRAASTDISVLIIGETGAGKELLANHVHQNSSRRTQSFLQLNCASLSESLLESELFGHEKGAFTGAVSNRAGLLESTKGGTVFLDELGEMPLSTQAKLLRVLEEQRIRRVGSNKSVPIDVRFVAATNRDMEVEVAAGRFRGDLYYRISGIVLHLPPLRERPSEIEPLARFFLKEHCLRSKIEIPEVSDSAISALLRYAWPGNVRELKNAMERAPILSGGEPIGPQHLPGVHAHAMRHTLEDFEDIEENTDISTLPRFGTMGRSARVTDPVPSPRPAMRDAIPPLSQRSRKLVHKNSRDYSMEQERDQILSALEECSGNQTRAAKLLGVSRRTLINRLDHLGVARPRKGT